MCLQVHVALCISNATTSIIATFGKDVHKVRTKFIAQQNWMQKPIGCTPLTVNFEGNSGPHPNLLFTVLIVLHL